MTKTGLWFVGLLQRVKYRISQRMTRVDKPAVRPATSFADIVIRVAYGQLYRKDGRRDRMSHPRLVQARIDKGEVQLGDCEDHAAYWIACLIKSRLAERVYLGNLQFRDAGERAGHAVVVFESDGDWYWADYGMPSLLPSREHWAEYVLAIYGDEMLGGVLTRVSLNADDTINFGEAILYPKNKAMMG